MFETTGASERNARKSAGPVFAQDARHMSAFARTVNFRHKQKRVEGRKLSSGRASVCESRNWKKETEQGTAAAA